MVASRLPNVGGDDGNWGTILNDYLSQSLSADGSLNVGTVGPVQLKPNSVTSAAIADGHVTSAKIADGAISRAQLADDAVGEAQLADGGVGSSKLKDSAVTPAKIASLGVANGIATLAADARLPEDQVPERLSSLSLDATYVRPADVKDGSGRRLDSLEVGRGFEQRRRRAYPLPRYVGVTSAPPTYTFGKGGGFSGVSVASGGTGYVVNEIITVGGGTAVVPGRLRVTAVSAGAVTGIAIEVAGIYPSYPTNPAGQATSSGSGAGATFTLTTNGGVGGSLSAGYDAPGPQSPRIGFYGNGPSASGGNMVGNDTQCAFEWSTDALTMDIRMTAFNSSFQLFIDGERLAASPFTTDSSGGRYFLTPTFATRRVRTFRLVGFNLQFAGVAIPSTATIWAPTEPRRPRAWALGDSYTFGTGTTDTTASANCIMAEELGLDLITDGVGGASWTGSTAGTPTQRVNAKLAALNSVPEVVFLDLGYNNSPSLPDMTVFAASVDSTVAAIRAIVPNARIIMFGPATPVGSTANLSTIKNALSARASALNVSFVDVEGWITTNNRSIYTGGDNVHPTPEGHIYLGERKARAVAALLASAGA